MIRQRSKRKPPIQSPKAIEMLREWATPSFPLMARRKSVDCPDCGKPAFMGQSPGTGMSWLNCEECGISNIKVGEGRFSERVILSESEELEMMRFELHPLHPAIHEIRHLKEQVEALKQELGRPFVMERGPWSVSDDGKCISSDDFTHDVMLRVSGDFGDDEARRAYSEELARHLNNGCARGGDSPTG